MLLLILTQKSFSQIIPLKPITLQSEKRESCSYSEKQIELNVTKLPVNYHGNDLKDLIAEMYRRSILTKGEFEKTTQFLERIDVENKKPIVGELYINTLFAFEIENGWFKYDADTEMMNFESNDSKLLWNDFCQSSKRNERSLNLVEKLSLSKVSIEMPIEKAKRIKENLRAIIIGKPSKTDWGGIYTYNERFSIRNINFTPEELWIYDLESGEIFLKQKLKDNEAKQAQEKIRKYISNAKTFYENGNDDAALKELRQLLSSEPMSAEAYLWLGKIHFRRGDLEQVINSLRTALFWDNKLIEAHIIIGKVYLQRGDCLQAKNYSSSALVIDSENQDAKDLQKQVERCGR